MIDVHRRNELARTDGKIGERIASERIDGLTIVNELIDAILDNKPCEIKTTREWQRNGYYGSNRKTRWCRGRFVLNEKQHSYLIENDGYYIFVLLKSNRRHRLKIVRAREIEFKRKITWTKIFDES